MITGKDVITVGAIILANLFIFGGILPFFISAITKQPQIETMLQRMMAAV